MTLSLSLAEQTALRAKGMAVFEDRIIQRAQPPITDADLARVAARCSGPIPDGLVALWRNAFGGSLDYQLEGDFGGVIASISFCHLFYPNSGHYRDLWGWIDHEAELAEDSANEDGKPWSGKLDYLPFGGFEYCSRMYVRVAPGPKHGEVVAWEQGLPGAWRLRLHNDSIATIGPDIASLFRLLAFEELLKRGAVPDTPSAIDAAYEGQTESALMIARAVIASDPAAAQKLADEARRRARAADESAIDIEEKRLISSESADEYRARAKALRSFAKSVLAPARCVACGATLEYVDPRAHDIDAPQLACKSCGGMFDLAAHSAKKRKVNAKPAPPKKKKAKAAPKKKRRIRE